jgi:8-oxo-dGTP pyrophosphatase MutT (NUDIX family)
MSAVPRASSVILLRDGADGVEAWLMRRVLGMAFAAGMTVFPGGRVDPQDADPRIAVIGGDLAGLAGRLGTPRPDARAVVVAAARELFEETGVLLIQPAPAAGDADHLATLRRRLESRELSFTEVLRETGGALDLDVLRPWARWVTPRSEPRRYDTHFFLAALPAGASAVADTPEAAAAHWLPIRTALAEARTGERLMLPPTQVMLGDLAPFPSVAAALATAPDRNLDAVLPVMERGTGGWLARLPDGSAWPVPAVRR